MAYRRIHNRFLAILSVAFSLAWYKSADVTISLKCIKCLGYGILSQERACLKFPFSKAVTEQALRW